MHWLKILTPLCAASLLTVAAPFAQAQNPGDAVLLDMQKAFRSRNQAALTQLLPQAAGHPLEPWAAYWELKNRLESASPDEIQGFLNRYAGTYQEDRLRNDWLLLLGKQRDWNTFSQVYPKFRMRDDKSVTCYALLADALQGRGAPNVGQQVRDLWLAQKDADDGCTTAAGQLYANKLITDADVWRRARVATESNRQKAARDAVAIVAPEAADQVAQVFASPVKYLAGQSKARGRERKELALLALIHNQLWLGDGGVARAQALQAQIDAQQKANALVQQEVERLRSEVLELKTGYEMVEEKARGELGMLKPGEIYIQITQ